jgi:hypothetical protein
LIRLPGYPLFMAGVYALFGHDNNTAVRVVQAVFDTGTVVIVGAIAWLWTEDPRKKLRNTFWAFFLAATCPFIAIYIGMILTETLTTFLMVAIVLFSTLAFMAARWWTKVIWWIVTGALAGISVTLRPDSGLFVAAVGLTIVISGLFLERENEAGYFRRTISVFWQGAVLSLAFALVLTPWAIRNYRLFGVFQPLAPTHAEMPGEFVPFGYYRWLRTWVDDFRFIEPTLWNLGEKPLEMSSIPSVNFDSPEEKERVAALLQQYNHPPGTENPPTPEEEEAPDNPDEDPGDSADDQQQDETDTEDNQDTSDEDEDRQYVVKMTPEIDAGFAAIADERIARSPARYYLFLPAKRAAALWFDSHSLY